MESCFAYLVHHHFKVLKNKSPIKAKVLYGDGQRLSNLFQNEHLFDYEFSEDKYYARL